MQNLSRLLHPSPEPEPVKVKHQREIPEEPSCFCDLVGDLVRYGNGQPSILVSSEWMNDIEEMVEL